MNIKEGVFMSLLFFALPITGIATTIIDIILAILLFLYCSYVTFRGYPSPIQEYDNLLFGGKDQQERLKILNKTYKDEV